MSQNGDETANMEILSANFNFVNFSLSVVSHVLPPLHSYPPNFTFTVQYVTPMGQKKAKIFDSKCKRIKRSQLHTDAII